MWGSFFVKAQEEGADDLGTQEVTVVKSYSPSLKDVFKIRSLPAAEDTLVYKKQKIEYTFETIPVISTFIPNKASPLKLNRQERTKGHNSYVSGGIGNNAFLKFDIPSNIDSTYKINLNLTPSKIYKEQDGFVIYRFPTKDWDERLKGTNIGLVDKSYVVSIDTLRNLKENEPISIDVRSIIDTAGGYAALSLFKPGDGVLTVEFKINCLSRAIGEKLIAKSEVIKCGRTLTVTKGEVIVINNNRETVCALMQQTVMRITGENKLEG